MRLTPRGRLVLLVLLLAVVCGLAVLASSASDAASGDPPASVVVQPGDTLWSIVARYLPSGRPFATIDKICRLNGLDGVTIRVGQRLLLPGRP